MRERAEDFKFQEDGHMKVSKDGFASKQRVDLNDLLRRASKQKLDDKRNNIIIASGVIFLVIVTVLILNI